LFKLHKLIFILLLKICGIANAQFYEYGQDPASLKWFQLDTEHFRLIYPTDFSMNVNMLANKLEKNYTPNSEQLGHYPRKIPVIFHNQTVISNGFVGWAPRRIEFFTYPDPNLFGQDWLSDLCLHEFRHVIQVDKLNQSTTRILSLIAGEMGTGLVAAMLPFWFLEGDAVTAETKLSNSGRGRLPSFEMEIKAQLLSSKKPYSFSKSYLGSYKDFVTDYWHYGYQMVSYTRKTYGDDYWTNAIDYIAKKPFLIFPLHHYSKLQTGASPEGLHLNAMNYLKNYWTLSLSKRKVEEVPTLTKRKRETYTSYTQAKFNHDGSVISLKTGMDIIPRFVKIDSFGNEKKIFVPGTLNSEKISVSHSKIIWDEFASDPRWRNRNYSVLKEYDMNTGLSRKLTSHTRYSAPEFSSTGDTIAVIEATPGYEFFLILLSSSSGKVLDRIPSPGNAWLQDPAWLDGKNEIIVISVNDNGKKILSYNLLSKYWFELYNSGYTNISELNSRGNSVYFNASFDGVDNIYSLDINDSILYKLSYSKFGAFQPDISLDNSKLVYSDYSERGYELKINKIDQYKKVKYSIPDNITEQSFNPGDNKNTNSPTVSQETDSSSYNVKPYSKLTHLFKIHSWSPFYFDYNNPQIDDPPVSPGISILSQNHLGTAISNLSYEYKDKTSFLHSAFIYKGLYPVFEFSVVYGGTPHLVAEKNTILPTLKPNMNYSLLTYIPLTLNSGKLYSGLQPSAKFTYNSAYFYYSQLNAYKRGIIFFEPGLYLYSYLKTAHRDLQPRLGFTLNIRNISTPFENELYGSNTSLQSTMYLPGILRNQGIKLKAEWQNQKTTKFLFSNLLNFPRGYDQLPAISFSKYSVDYLMPLLYPDYSFGTIFYCKRLRANLFLDYLNGTDIYVTSSDPINVIPHKEFLSEGVELYEDFHLFHLIFEFSSGIRISYLNSENKFKYQFLFRINLDKF
jgi:hypothetical protein